ncbi:MAG: C40 family peptidase [Bacteroidales bacterium]|jgi:hypothetical protein|nr:C40 family peptidase [Bacteroidales bacterium]
MLCAICKESIAPVYEINSDTGAIVTQMLFGEICRITEKDGTWVKILVAYDNYEGWINEVQLKYISEDFFDEVCTQKEKYYLNELTANVMSEQNTMTIVLGSSLPLFKDRYFFIGDEKYKLNSDEDYKCYKQTPERIVFFASKYFNAPYLWGGRSPFGIDCSGFVQNVFKFCGYFLPRDVSQQKSCGEIIENFVDAQKNDLLFFSRVETDGICSQPKIVHVGIYLGNNKMIHAHGSVKVKNLDENGIKTHHLEMIRRIM